MEDKTKEIAALLRSTEEMAVQFVRRVQSRVGQTVSHAQVLAAMQEISTRSLSFEKVVAKVQKQQKSPRRPGKQTTRQPRQATTVGEDTLKTTSTVSSSVASVRNPKTILGRLEAVLGENWDRAEAEGLHPERMSTEAFVRAVYQHTDRREGTRQRILQAATQLNRADVVLTPALVADAVHELFES